MAVVHEKGGFPWVPKSEKSLPSPHHRWPVVLPFVLGAGMALAAEPGVRFLCSRLRLPRGLAAGITVSGVFLIICVLITMVLTLLLLTFMGEALRDALDPRKTLADATPAPKTSES